MRANSFTSIFRTSWIESTTGAQKGGEGELIESNQQNSECFHGFYRSKK